MASALGKILDASPDNKIVWLVGNSHLVDEQLMGNKDERFPSAAALLRKNYKIATAAEQRTEFSRDYLGRIASDVKETVAIPTAKTTELRKLTTNSFPSSESYGSYNYIFLYPTKQKK